MMKRSSLSTLFVNMPPKKQQQVIPPLPEQQFHKKSNIMRSAYNFSESVLSSPGDLSKTGYNKAANIAVRFLTKYSFENLYL